MSGGAFNYSQHKILDMIDRLNELVLSNESEVKDAWGDPVGRFYSKETIEEFNTAIRVLNDAYTYSHRIDWLISGDDSEESFHRLLKEDLIITSKDQKMVYNRLMNNEIKKTLNDFVVIHESAFEQWWAEELKKDPVLVRHSKEEARIQWNRGVLKGIESGN